jgi:DNA-binding transcriptional LysR family regulator
MSIDPRHLIQLSAIVDTGSFAEAAEQLSLAQSALSRNIKTLEERVGMPVLKRGRRGAVPTEIGTSLAQYGSVIRTANRQATSVVTSVSSPRADQLRIGATQVIAENFLIDPLTEFMRRRTNVSCSIQTGNVDDLIAIVTLGEVDLALGQFGVMTNTRELHLEPLIEDYFTVIARAGHPLADAPQPATGTLARMSWVVPGRETRLRRQIENALRYLGIESIDVSYEASSMGVLIALVKKTDCVAMVPRFAVSPLIDEGHVVELVPDRTAIHRSIGILCQAAKRNSAIVNSFYADLHRFARRAMANAGGGKP